MKCQDGFQPYEMNGMIRQIAVIASMTAIDVYQDVSSNLYDQGEYFFHPTVNLRA